MYVLHRLRSGGFKHTCCILQGSQYILVKKKANAVVPSKDGDYQHGRFSRANTCVTSTRHSVVQERLNNVFQYSHALL